MNILALRSVYADKDKLLLYFVYIIYLVGIFGHLINEIHTIISPLTPFVILVTGLAAINGFEINKKFYLWFSVVFIFSFLKILQEQIIQNFLML